MRGCLDGTTVLVTGVGAGVGAEAARVLARQGARVALLASGDSHLGALVGEITAEGGAAYAVPGDPLAWQDVDAALTCAQDRFGSLFAIVNNAGEILVDALLSSPVDEWDQVVENRLRGLLDISRRGLPYLIDTAATTPSGAVHVVNLGSARRDGAERLSGSAHALSKHAVTALTVRLRREATGSPVRVSALPAELVSTHLARHMLTAPADPFAQHTVPV